MGFFDFVKKKEFETINKLQETIRTLVEQKENLEERVHFFEKYQAIVDVESEVNRRIKEADDLIRDRMSVLKQQEQESANKIKESQQRLDNLQCKYNEGYKVYEDLLRESDIYKETVDLANYGVYDPHFEFDTPDGYKEAIYNVRNKQKDLIKYDEAVLGGDDISWNGSLFQGSLVVRKEKTLILRAFNGDCDSFIAEVEWNNVAKMRKRIEKSYMTINKLFEKQGIYISRKYADLKLDELDLAYEYRLKRREEKEEQRAIREQMREEEKVRREIEAAIQKAQKEEDIYQRALDKAREEVVAVQGAEYEKLQVKIKELEARVAEAEANKERALSMAQQTKRGHVYVISNIGSFGEDIYKIGMTRRLDPMDRVRELGNASVPFPFDVHAIIFSEDAPVLESKLHKAFNNKRVNLMNSRKEFFHVTLQEIEDVVHENNAEIEFTKLAEARDYRESMAIREQNENVTKNSDDPALPRTLFAS